MLVFHSIPYAVLVYITYIYIYIYIYIYLYIHMDTYTVYCNSTWEYNLYILLFLTI